jgi:hypothetical protein
MPSLQEPLPRPRVDRKEFTLARRPRHPDCPPPDEFPGVDTFVVPVGGGGLISGVAIAAKASIRRQQRRDNDKREDRRHYHVRLPLKARHRHHPSSWC